MAAPLKDKIGAPVAIRDDVIDASADEDRERIVLHTDVDPRASARGLADLLVRGSIEGSCPSGFGVVPVCPLFASRPSTRGEDLTSDGGGLLRSSPQDVAVALRVVFERSGRPA
ncbi:hypothetical protein AB0K08_16755 [Citricoccus sp. NPDC055426]|uniref:hypothetical protein n=1 Tax=Citricoccus sp. NPDC055426 TaxID=3155536 RepID=UPI003435DD89